MTLLSRQAPAAIIKKILLYDTIDIKLIYHLMAGQSKFQYLPKYKF